MPTLRDLPATRRHASFRRAWALLKAFPTERSNPAGFYTLLSHDTVALLWALRKDYAATQDCISLGRVLDVGSGPGWFGNYCRQAKVADSVISVEPDPAELLAGTASGVSHCTTVRGDGRFLPFADDTFDVVVSSNAGEHTPDPWALAFDSFRVLRPGGLMLLSYTVWLGPFGGHETGMLNHWIGGDFARRRYEKKHGHPPKNVFGESLFDVSCNAGIEWALAIKRSGRGRIVALIPRYHPSWAWWVVRVPYLREIVVSNLCIAITKTGE